jgi:hypothetical protein
MGFPYTGTRLLPALAFLFISVLNRLNAVESGIPACTVKELYECGEGYTLHVNTAGGGEEYTLHVCSPYVGQRYTLNVHIHIRRRWILQERAQKGPNFETALLPLLSSYERIRNLEFSQMLTLQ